MVHGALVTDLCCRQMTLRGVRFPQGPVTRASPLRGDTGAMNTLIWLLVSFCAAATLLHLAGILIAACRCRPVRPARGMRAAGPPVSIVRPVCGIELPQICNVDHAPVARRAGLFGSIALVPVHSSSVSS
jgi:hypothetical protein